jgi:hypothetical protein
MGCIKDILMSYAGPMITFADVAVLFLQRQSHCDSSRKQHMSSSRCSALVQEHLNIFH